MHRRTGIFARGRGWIALPAAVLGLSNCATPDGTWELDPNEAPIEVIHAALVSPTKILAIGGSQYNCCYKWGYIAAYVYDIPGKSWTSVGGPYVFTGDKENVDAFCSGMVQDGWAQGNIIVAGGLRDVVTKNGQGILRAARFNAALSNWTQLGDLPARRYYPTLVSGLDHVMMFAGADNLNDDRIFKKLRDQNTWIDTKVSHRTTATYPRVHLLPDGRYFIVSPEAKTGRNYYYHSSNYLTEAGPAVVPGFEQDGNIYKGFHFSSVLLPLKPLGGAYPEAKVLITNGLVYYTRDAMNPNSSWVPTQARPKESGFPMERPDATATLLPTEQVFLDGGTVGGSDAKAVKRPELYGVDIGGSLWGETWSLQPPATVTRNYHSVSLLLPDGRVWTAGSNKNATGSQCTSELGCSAAGPDNRERRVEIFAPWYYNNPDPALARPVITSCPEMPGIGTNYTIGIGGNKGTDIKKVVLIRTGSVTHSWNNDQRLVRLDIVSSTASSVTVKSPYTFAAAPAGTYLLFVLKTGPAKSSPLIPSEGCWLQRPTVQIPKPPIEIPPKRPLDIR